MNYTEQLELEAETRRRELSASLDELRDRFSPGQMVEQLVDYVQEGSGGQFFHNLQRQVVGNPLPVALIGAGVAWLMMANGRARNGDGRLHYRDGGGRARSGMRRAMATATDTVSETRTRVEDGGEHLKEAAEETLSSIRDTARETYDEVYDAASGMYEQVSARAGRSASAMADSIRTLGHGTAETGHSIAQFCREQPLVVAGIGLAIGAALGAALPTTEMERRTMGDASDRAKRKMRELASETIDKAQAVGERVMSAAEAAAVDEAREQGLSEPSDEDVELEGRSDENPRASMADPDDAPRDESDAARRTG